jgi:TonB-dependent starch-binding outer membrane protein SusC
MKRNLTKSDFHRERFRNAFMKMELVFAFFFIGVVTLTAGMGTSDLFSPEMHVQERTVTGIVRDQGGVPLPGVSVVVKGTTTGTSTDSNGQFRLVIPADAEVLVFSYVGMVSSEITIENQVTFEVTLSEDTVLMEDLVVIGYGIARRADLTGAVSVVEERNLNRGVFSSPAELLQGKVPGLNITRSGDPAETPSITLRGPSTLRSGAAMEPFYVIDGVPGASIQAIAPGDIVRIDILRDASSTAIYGSRAANGVIMVTTRRPAAGESYISYDGYTSVETIANSYTMLTGDELRSYLSAIDRQPDDDDGSNINWQDEVLRNGISQNHNLSMGGSFGESRYSASINYFNNQGIIKSSSRERLTGRLSMEHSLLNERAVIGLNLSVTETKDDRVLTQVYQNMLRYLPTRGIYNPDGGYYENLQYSMYHNPVGLINNDIIENNSRNLLTNMTLNVNLFEGLTYNGSLAYQNTDMKNNTYHKIASSYLPGLGGYAIRNNYVDDFVQFENYLTYQNTYGSHNITLLGGYSWQENSFGDGFQAANSNFISDDLTYHNFQVGSSPDRVSETDRFGTTVVRSLRMISLYSRLNYNFDDRYLVQVTVRRDGSSAFGELNRWANFPAASFAWRITGEPFMENQQLFHDLKLRLGYGISGNSLGFDPMIARLKYGLVGTTFIGGETIRAVGVTQNANPNLKWETTSVINLGIDFAFLENRINGVIEVYDKKTTDLIWNYPVRTPPYLYPNILANVGEIDNRGIEFQLNAVAINSGRFQWTTSFNISHNRNEVVKLSSDEFETPERGINAGGVGGVGQSGNPLQIIKEGYPLGTFYVRKWAGRDDDGVSMFYDIDGVPQYTVTVDDFYIFGSAQPDFIYGWSNSFSFGNLDLSFFLRGVSGNTIMNATLAGLNNPINATRNNIPRFTLDEPVTDYNSFFQSDRYLENGSYLRMDNATIGYTFNLTRYGLNSARLYITGNNLFIITNYRGIDPEINMGGITPGIDAYNFYPMTRSFMLGLNVGF